MSELVRLFPVELQADLLFGIDTVILFYSNRSRVDIFVTQFYNIFIFVWY